MGRVALGLRPRRQPWGMGAWTGRPSATHGVWQLRPLGGRRLWALGSGTEYGSRLNTRIHGTQAREDSLAWPHSGVLVSSCLIRPGLLDTSVRKLTRKTLGPVGNRCQVYLAKGPRTLDRQAPCRIAICDISNHKPWGWRVAPISNRSTGLYLLYCTARLASPMDRSTASMCFGLMDATGLDCPKAR